ncbi:MAG: FAD:protein FMN transferase, partial [Oscillibacter sp.]|nr:FAD:protein FMN transferase [Oscillibacter sp.]
MRRYRFLIFLWTLLLLTGCSATPEEEPCRYELMAMDTIMSLTIYGKPAQEAQDILQQAAGQIQDLDALLSVTNEESEIYRINHSGGEAVQLSERTRELLGEALELCQSTEGALDITIYPVVRTWGFTTGEYRVPEE